MTQPHQIDREAVALWGCADGNGVDPRLVFRDRADALAAAAELGLTVQALYAAPEAVAWREKVVCDAPPDGWFCTRPPGHEGPCAAWPKTGAVAAIVSAHVYVRDGQTIVDSGAAAEEIERHYDAILALISTHPVQGGEG